jgi:uncharacterized protein (DUF885 family)
MLTKMDANQARMKAIQEQMDANQAKTKADQKANQEKAKAKADQEELKGMMNATQERMDANTKSMQEDIKSGQAEMRSATGAIEEKMDAWIANMKDDREETTACQYAIETSLKNMEPNSGEKEAVVERQKIPNEDVAIHFLGACRSETAASKEAMETEPDPKQCSPWRSIKRSLRKKPQ